MTLFQQDNNPQAATPSGLEPVGGTVSPQSEHNPGETQAVGAGLSKEAKPAPADTSSASGVPVHAAIKSAGEKWLVPIATLAGAVVTLSTIIGQLPGVSSLGFIYNWIAPFLYLGRGVLVPLLALLGLGALVWGIRGRMHRTKRVWRFGVSLTLLLLMAAILVIRPSERIVGVLPYVPTSDSKADVATGQALADYLRGTLNRPNGLIKAIGVSRVAGESISDAGKRAGAEMLVDGSYTLGKGGVEVSTSLYDVASGDKLGNSQTRHVLAENLQSSQQEVAESLAEQIDVASAVSSKAYASAGLNCSTAYECYVVGRRYYLWFNEEGYNRAIAYYGAALGFDANYARAYAGLAEADLLLSGLSRYRGKTQDANRLWDLAGDEAGRAVEKGPGLVETHRARAWVYSSQGLRRNARSEYDLIAKLSPPSPEMVLTATGVLTSIHPSGDAESLWLLGSDTTDANTKIALFSEALRLKPDLAQVQYDLGVVLYYQGRLDDAEASIRRALNINPNMIYAHVGLGQLYLTHAVQGQASSVVITTTQAATAPTAPTAPTSAANYLIEAGRQVDIALEQLPDYASALFIKGAILSAQGSLQPAIKTTRQALEGSREVGMWYSYQFYDDPAMYRTSIESLQQAIQALPEYVYNYNTLGNFYMAEGHTYEAQRVYSEAVNLDPSFGTAWYNLSVTQSFLGQYDSAIISARHAVSETKGWSAAYYQLGASVLARAENERPDMVAAGAAGANPSGTPAAVTVAGLPTPVANAQAVAGCSQKTAPPQADIAAGLAEAVAMQRKAVEIDPRNTLAHSSLGQALFDQGLLARIAGRDQDVQPRFEEARTQLEEGAKGANEFDAQTHYLLGLVYMNEQHHDQAAGEFEKAFLINPAGAAVVKTYADFLSTTNSQEAAKLYTRSLSLYASILADHPRSPLYHGQMAALLQSAGQSDRALQEYNTALQLDPTSPYLNNALGLYYFAYGKYDQALGAFTKASRLAPIEPAYKQNTGDAAKGLAQQEEQQGNKEGATQHYNLALSSYASAEELNPSGDYHSGIGDVYLAQGDYDRAAGAYKKAICMAPTTAAMVLNYQNLAQLQVVREDYKGAAETLNTALRIVPADPSLHNELGLVYSDDLDKPDEGIAEFRLAVKLAPGVALYHDNLAYSLFAQTRYDEAAVEFKAALDVAPSSDSDRWNYAYYLGRSYFALKRVDEAQKALEQSVKLNPKQPDAHAWLALVYHNASDARACEEMKKAHAIALASTDSQVQANDKDYLAAIGQWGCP